MTDIVRQLGTLHLDDGLKPISEDEGLGVSTDQLPPDLTLLPNTAVHAIFCNLDATDKRNLFRTSKSVRELFAHHLCSISVSLPSDDEYIRGYGSLPRTLQGLPPSMRNMSIRISRMFFNACHGSRLLASGEALPHSQLALMDFISSPSQPNKEGSNQIVANASRVELQGYCLTAPPASHLASNCSACTHVRLSDIDLRGLFFQELSKMRCCSHLELTHVHLLDREAHNSLESLGSMHSLKSLVLARVMYANVSPDPRTDHTPVSVLPCRHPDFSLLAHLRGLHHLRVQLAEGLVCTPSAAQFVAWASSCHHLSSLAVLGVEGLQHLSNADLAPLVCGCALSLRSLQFDQHVVVTGVQALLQMPHLEHVCARSLEPQPYECLANTSPCSLHSLSLGGCCPSVAALAALPLHSLTKHFDITKLDLGPLAKNNPATMADVLAAAVRNMARCPSLRIMGGKLELAGRPMPTGPPAPLLPNLTTASQGGLVADVAPLLALEPLAFRGLTHLKLSGFALTVHHIHALASTVGQGLTALTFSDCGLNMGMLQALIAHGGSFPHLHQISFARYCVGVDLHMLTSVLSNPKAAPLQVFLLYPLGSESTAEEGLVASDAAVGEAMQDIIAIHGFGRIQLHVRWSV
uniref:F-box domain-containing protein n=1 Tax=Dunaliella tertiolecta TaxID=3047 RepID=A0A7S3QJS6_DUNTE